MVEMLLNEETKVKFLGGGLYFSSYFLTRVFFFFCSFLSLFFYFFILSFCYHLSVVLFHCFVMYFPFLDNFACSRSFFISSFSQVPYPNFVSLSFILHFFLLSFFLLILSLLHYLTTLSSSISLSLSIYSLCIFLSSIILPPPHLLLCLLILLKLV